MDNIFRISIVFLTIVGCLALLPITAIPQAVGKDLLRLHIEKDFSSVYMLEVLNYLQIEKKVPIGLELTTNYDEVVRESMYLENGSIKWREGPLNIRSGSLKDVLDSLVEQDTNYEWKVVDGVINICPVSLRDDFVEEILNTKVKHFSLFTGDEKFRIRDSIYEIPEFREFADRFSVSLLKRAYSYKLSDAVRSDNVCDFEDISVRGILNATVRLTENKMWVIKRIGARKDTLDLTF